MWINFRHWRQMKRWPRQTNCMQFDQFSQAINIFEKSNSNKQTRVERERGRSILVYQTRIKKTSYYPWMRFKWSRWNWTSRYFFFEYLTFLIPYQMVPFYNLFSYLKIICHLEIYEQTDHSRWKRVFMRTSDWNTLEIFKSI